MKVKEVMTPFPDSVHPGDLLRDAAEKMKALNLDPMPVTENDRFVGVLSAAEITARAAESGLGTATVPVRDVMSGVPMTIRDDEEVEAALKAVETDASAREFSTLPVVDVAGKLVGTVARDSLQHRYEEEHAGDGVAAVFDVESISSIADFSEDRVEYMSDESFPASDPPPPPGAFGPGVEK